MTDLTLEARRKNVLPPKISYFFDEILHIVKGEGMWLWDTDGTRYLDFYNNVPSVGHCHPKVLEALVKQASLLNVSTRYLHDAVVEFAEALTEKLPSHLDTCYFACTGTEANDLAVQMARHLTGNQGVLVGEYCYHGNSTLVYALSTDSYPAEERPDWLAVFEVPDPYQGSFDPDDTAASQRYLASAIEQLDKLEARGFKLAAALIDSSFDNIGVVIPPPGFMSGLFNEVRRRGGLLIADEVQAGYCRMGTHWWGFQHHGMEPDIVTCSKPMGDGHPISALVTTRIHAQGFAEKVNYFNTTAGNPVSSAVGKAVLEVFDEEGLLQRATETGAYLSRQLNDLSLRHELVGTARGYGMFQGLEIVSDAGHKTPVSHAQTRHLTTLIAREGLITGISGINGNVVKLRPPLIAEKEHVDLAVEALDRALTRYAQEIR